MIVLHTKLLIKHILYSIVDFMESIKSFQITPIVFIIAVVIIVYVLYKIIQYIVCCRCWEKIDSNN